MIKLFILILSILFTLNGFSSDAVEEIYKRGQLRWRLGTEFYIINKDHSFSVEPIMSGRSIVGKWYVD